MKQSDFRSNVNDITDVRQALQKLKQGLSPVALSTSNTDDAIGSLTFSSPPTQAECEALRDACETLADDVRALLAVLTLKGIIE